MIGASRDTPVVAACLGMSAPDGRLAGASLAATLEGGALRVAEILGRPAPDLGGSPGEAEAAIARVGAGRTAVRGFFTGGTLCYEAQVILSQALGPVYSNIPLRPGPRAARAGRRAHLPGPRRGGVHQGPAAPDDRPGRAPGDHAGAGVRRRHRGGAARRRARLRLAPRSGRGDRRDLRRHRGRRGGGGLLRARRARRPAGTRPAARQAGRSGRDRHRERGAGGADRGRDRGARDAARS